MRRRILVLALLMVLAPGCTLLRSEPERTPPVVTATLPEPLQTAAAQAAAAPTLTAAAWALASLTPAATATPSPTDTPTPPPSLTPSITPTPSHTPLPSPIPPTRTIPGPTAAAALDDGGGGIVPGTGGRIQVVSPVEGVTALPATLYYLSDDGAQSQVFRLRVGLNHPDQLTFSASGVTAFDVSPDGTLAYLTPAGYLFVGGVPTTPPALADGTLPAITDLAWSPNGLWLAYVVHSADLAEGEHPVDGLWLRNAVGSSHRVAASVYGTSQQRVITGPLWWQPGGGRVLAGYTGAEGSSLGLAETAGGGMASLWQGTANSPVDAAWTADGSAAVVSDGERIVRINPSGGSPVTLFDDGATAPRQAYPLAGGALSFVGTAADGGARLFHLTPGQERATALMPPAAAGSRLSILWDDAGHEALIVIRQDAGALMGQGYWLDAGRALHNLGPLTGAIGAPRWGPLFQSGDNARVQTPSGQSLNMRNAPNGAVIAGLVAGSPVMVTSGPFDTADARWWHVRTRDGRTGWVIESMADGAGASLLTLHPLG